MKRNVALIFAGGLTVIVATAIVIGMLSVLVTPTAADQAQPEPVVENVPALPSQPVDFEAAQQVEATIQAREGALQEQISQRQAALAELDQTAQAQINQLQAQLIDLQSQIDQTTANLPTLQANAAALQQAIQQDEVTFQAEMSRLADTEQQLRGQLEAGQAQLNLAYNELAQRQAAAAAVVNSSGGGRSHDDDDDDHERHDDDDEHERHDDDDHEGHDDDD